MQSAPVITTTSIGAQPLATDLTTLSTSSPGAGGLADLAEVAPVASPASPYTVATAVRTITVVASTTIILPASGIVAGEAITVANNSASSVTITFQRSGSDTIDGGAGNVAVTVQARSSVAAQLVSTGAYTTVQDAGSSGALQAANNLSDVASISTARTNLGLVQSFPCSDIPTILASGTAGQFERHPTLPTVIRAPLATVPTYALADAKGTPPRAWTLTNGANLTSAAIAGGVLSLVATVGTATDWSSGTRTAPHYSANYLMVNGAPQGAVLVARVTSASTMVSTRLLGLAVRKAGTGSTSFFRILAGYLGASHAVYQDNGSANTTTNITAGEWTQKLWLRLYVVGTTIYGEWCLSAATTPPRTGWVRSVRSQTFAAGDTLEMGIVQQTDTDTTTAFTGQSLYYDDRSLQTQAYAEGQDSVAANPCYAFGANPTSDPLIFGDIDAGVAGGFLPSTTKIRARLADAINRLPGDAGTWTWSLTGSDSASPAAATTYQSAAALVLKQPSSDTTETVARRYWRLRGICESASGTQTASVDVALLGDIWA